MLENISSEQIKSEFGKNKTLRLATFAVGGLIILVGGFFLYKQFVSAPKNDDSKDSYWMALNHAQTDSTDLAIDEARAAVKKFDGYVGGENAQFILGRQLMNKGEFDAAIKELEGVDAEDTYVSAMALGLIGDCYSELGKYKDAIASYEEAANKNANEFTSPQYLFKAGLCCEEVKDFNKAKEYYETIKDDYNTFAGQKQIDKYIARVSTVEVK